MILEYNNKKYQCIFKDMEVLTDNNQINNLIKNNKLESTLMICYFKDINLNLNELIKE